VNDLLLKACRRQPVPRPPVWLMRQAGRYLPEYRVIRARHDFLTMVRTPELASQVTLQPVDRLGVDAAIIFSDILVIPMALGMTLSVEEGVGPVLHRPLRSERDIGRLRPFDPEGELSYLLDAIRMTRAALGGRVPLIGFAGAPWTLAGYMVEGAGTREWRAIKRLIAEAPATAHRLLDLLTEAVGRTLVAQAAAGVQVLQIFDSWAGALAPRDFDRFALPYLARAARSVRATGLPVIVFAPGADWALESIAKETGADVVSIGWHTRPAEARSRLASFDVACQGNFDPAWLYSDPDVIRERVREMIAEFGVQGYIANLGHGVLKDTPVEHVQEFVSAVQGWKSSGSERSERSEKSEAGLT
jgi:uroporphyrinogen decarboxylase